MCLATGALDQIQHTLPFAIGIDLPGHRPNPVEVPSQPLQHPRAQPLTVTRIGRDLPGRAITLDTQQVSARCRLVLDADVDPAPAVPDVPLHMETGAGKVASNDICLLYTSDAADDL